ncbi:type 11 methyltransferase [Salinisphaera dokdonensis CL-ES53]|uniref:Type 11 methyltransferase n=1 Tax=Salinisphaera dokdonensis CL-ES53 TaxID=1304272 RepID=A0ABV2B4I5_9GAMM
MTESNTNTSLHALRSASTDEIGSYYDQWAAGYDTDLAAFGYQAPQWVARHIAEAGVTLNAPILDAGCGTGLTGQALHALGYDKISGADISEESLAIARTKACYGTLQRQDLDQPLAFEDNAFAAIACVGTLTYVKNPRDLMASFCRVGQPGALVVFTQRDDCYDAAFAAALDSQVQAGRWRCRAHTGPHAYLPDHPEYGQDSAIYLDIYEVLD